MGPYVFAQCGFFTSGKWINLRVRLYSVENKSKSDIFSRWIDRESKLVFTLNRDILVFSKIEPIFI